MAKPWLLSLIAVTSLYQGVAQAQEMDLPLGPSQSAATAPAPAPVRQSPRPVVVASPRVVKPRPVPRHRNEDVQHGQCSNSADVTPAVNAISAELQQWVQRRSAYYSSSPEYAFAQRQVELQSQQLQDLISSPQVQTSSLAVLESLAKSLTETASTYYSSTTEYGAYNNSASILFDDLAVAVKRADDCGSFDMQSALDLATDYTNKAGEYYSSTAGYRGYTAAANQAFAAADRAMIRMALSRSMSYGDMDSVMALLYSRASNFYSSTDSYKNYTSMASTMATFSEQALSKTVSSLSVDQRFAEMNRYESLRSYCYSSTLPYGHYSNMIAILSQ